MYTYIYYIITYISNAWASSLAEKARVQRKTVHGLHIYFNMQKPFILNIIVASLWETPTKKSCSKFIAYCKYECKENKMIGST